MRLLIDGLYLTNQHLRGVGRYSQTLCDVIYRYNIGDLFVLVSTVKPRKIRLVRNNLAGINFKIIAVPIPGRFFKFLARRLDIYSIIKSIYRIDLIHVPYETYYKTKTNNFMTVHGMEPFQNPSNQQFYRDFRNNLKRSVSYVSNYISVSKFVKNEMQKYLFLEENKIHEIPISVDDHFFALFSKTSPRDLKLLYFGGFEDNKNLINLINVLDDLRENTLIPIKLKIIGDDKWHADRVKNKFNRDYIEKVGYLDKKELATEIVRSSCVIIPSRYEGYSLPLIESLSLQTPVLVSKHAGALEYVKGGYISFLPDSHEDICRAILEFYRNKKRLAKEAAEESKRLKENLNYYEMAQLLKKAYFHS
ncbi:glycosyltransferase [Thermodesulfobacteriota bacterium]